MVLCKAHGNAAKRGALLVVEGAPADGLPAGVPAHPRPRANRDEHGRFVKGSGTEAMAVEANAAKQDARKFRRLLGLVDLDDAHPYAGYLRLARQHRAEHGADLASTVGGGQLSPGVVSIVASASLALAASRFLYDLGAEQGDPKLLGQAAQLADKSRTALLTAHELAAREAEARARASQPRWPWLDVDNGEERDEQHEQHDEVRP